MATGLVKNSTRVYYGPSSITYPSIDYETNITSSVGPNETVKVLWLEGSWYYIEYAVASTIKRKRMYIPSTAVSNLTGQLESAPVVSKTINSSSSSTVYTGPNGTSYSYTISGSIGIELVTVYNKVESTFTFIEYSISGGQKKRGWVPTTIVNSIPSGSYYDYISNGWSITSPWNNVNGDYKGHLGIDAVKSGTKICAIAEGFVHSKSSKCLTNNGYTITLRHTISERTFYSFYAHMDTQPSISVNTHVPAGTELNAYGSSGKVTGPHVHIGVYMGSPFDDMYGYAKVNNQYVKFDDGGRGYYDFKNLRFYDPQKVTSTNGRIIATYPKI